MQTFVFGPKYAAELKKNRYIDFSAILLEGETIASASVASTPANLTANVATTAGVVSFDILPGGNVGHNIIITVTATGSAGTIAEAQAIIAIQRLI